MWVSDRLIYLQLPKTGSTHMVRLLKGLPSCAGREVGLHGSLEDHAAEVGDPAGRCVFGSVRNPWDWYVSLWAFGCAGGGDVRAILTGENFERQTGVVQEGRGCHEFRETYADPEDVEAFRRWLRLLLRDYRECGPEDFGRQPLGRAFGFFTYRYVRTYTRRVRRRDSLATLSDLISYADAHGVLDRSVRLEHLQEDLLEVLAQAGVPEEERVQAATACSNRANPSKRLPYPVYYDDASRQLVEREERFLLGRHGYRF